MLRCVILLQLKQEIVRTAAEEAVLVFRFEVLADAEHLIIAIIKYAKAIVNPIHLLQVIDEALTVYLVYWLRRSSSRPIVLVCVCNVIVFAPKILNSITVPLVARARRLQAHVCVYESQIRLNLLF